MIAHNPSTDPGKRHYRIRLLHLAGLTGAQENEHDTQRKPDSQRIS